MVLISLDQNFLWNFHTGGHRHAQELYNLIKQAVQCGAAACPVHSQELVEEGSRAPPERRRGIFCVAKDLCGNAAFRDFTWSVADETMSLLRPDHRPMRLLLGELSLPADLDTLGKDIRVTKKAYQVRLEKVRYPPPSFKPDMGVWDVYHELVKPRLGSMLRLVKSIRDKNSTKTGRIEWEYSMAIAVRLMQLGLRRKECDLLIDLICQRRWEETPTLLWHSRLCAELEFEILRANGKLVPNDYFDLSRLAVGLADADVVFCDRKMSALIQKTGFNAPPHFSWSTSGAGITCLKNLLYK
jgi:hypothetical protein